MRSGLLTKMPHHLENEFTKYFIRIDGFVWQPTCNRSVYKGIGYNRMPYHLEINLNSSDIL